MVRLDFKTPAEVLDYKVDFTEELTAESDTIVSVTWTLDPSFTMNAQQNTTLTATVWFTGGIAGALPQIKAVVTTAAGRKYERTAIVPVVAFRS